jgi:branched-chain amino acid transport system ATP-binding protein
VAKNVDALIELAGRHVVLEKGVVVWTGTSKALAENPAMSQRYLRI